MIRSINDKPSNNAARHFDPTVGRWINEEPVGYEAGDTNLYRYVGNAPCNDADPSGLGE